LARVVFRFEPPNVDEHFLGSREARKRGNFRALF